MNLADTAFLGQLGSEELAASGNAIIFYFLFIVVGIGFSIGAEIVVGRRNGEGNYPEIGRVVDHCFYILIPLSLILYLTYQVFGQSILEAVTANETIVGIGLQYLDFRVYGIFFAFMNLCFRTFYIGTTNTSILIWSTSIMAVVNIAFDYLLIFGNLGFPELGVKGAAIASVIAEVSALIYFSVYTLKNVDLQKYRLLAFGAIELKIWRNLFKVSLPIMLQHFIAIASWLFFFLIIEKMGTKELAISHIVRSIYMVLMIPLFGFSAATSTLVSNLIGQNQHEGVMAFTWKVSKLTLLATALILPMNLLFPEKMISFFTSDPEILQGSVSVIYVITASMFAFSLAFILFSAVSGTGNTQISLLIETSTLVIYVATAYSIVFVLDGSLPIVWCSEFVYFGLMGLFSFFYLRYGNWRNRVI